MTELNTWVAEANTSITTFNTEKANKAAAKLAMEVDRKAKAEIERLDKEEKKRDQERVQRKRQTKDAEDAKTNYENELAEIVTNMATLMAKESEIKSQEEFMALDRARQELKNRSDDIKKKLANTGSLLTKLANEKKTYDDAQAVIDAAATLAADTKWAADYEASKADETTFKANFDTAKAVYDTAKTAADAMTDGTPEKVTAMAALQASKSTF